MGQSLLFVVNGGVHHDDLRAVGLSVENGKKPAPLVRSAGPGNFGILPNGVFWLDGAEAGITETRAYDALFPAAPPRFATPSGPMLMLDGALHPDFNAEGPSRKHHNGVGLNADRRTLHFAISDAPLEFPQLSPPLPRPAWHTRRTGPGWHRLTSLRARDRTRRAQNRFRPHCRSRICTGGRTLTQFGLAADLGYCQTRQEQEP